MRIAAVLRVQVYTEGIMRYSEPVRVFGMATGYPAAVFELQRRIEIQTTGYNGIPLIDDAWMIKEGYALNIRFSFFETDESIDGTHRLPHDESPVPIRIIFR